MPGINLLSSRRAVRFKDLGRAGGGIPQAAPGEDLGTTEIAEIAKPLPMGPHLLSNWCGLPHLSARPGSLDAPTYPRVWNLKPPHWVEIKSQQLHVALGFKRRSFFFSRIQVQDGRVFPVSLMLFFHVFPPFPAFQLFWGDDRKIQVLLAVLCALAEAFGGALPIPKGMEFSGIMMISDQCLYLYLSISIFIYIYIYLYLYIYMFVYI